ncbi:hypothetical protein C0995_005849 [Termitomyces sp. Mi166|nr:hypothetical protein C0995_005849 [Termitomyces sp. Mi166\
MDQTATTFTTADRSQEIWRYGIAQAALQQLMLTLSDLIVIWRAWVIVRRPWIMGAPILLLVASTACGFAYIVILSSNFRWYIVDINLHLSLVSVMIDASLALSFLTNAFATLLIIHTLWLHLRSRKELGLHKPSNALKSLVIIVDTGVAFLLLQGLNIIVNFLPFDHYSALDFFQTAISGSYRLLTGMYPAIVVYLVNQQSSLVEVFALSDPNGNRTPQVPFDRTITIGPLVFARSDPTANTNATSLTVISDMDFRDIDEDTDKSGAISPVDCMRKKAQEMV